MARRGREADAEAAEVEVHVARGAQFHFDRCVASGRDFAQLERTGKAAADFGAHLSGVEGHAGVARADDKPLARGRADAVVVGETDVAGRDARAFAAEEAAPQVECKGRGREGPRGAHCGGTLRVGVVSGLGQAGAAPEFRSQLHGVEIGDRLPSVAVQHLYFRKDHNEWNISDKISEKPVNGQLFP